MSTTVDDVHHRNGEGIGVGTAEVAVKGNLQVSSGSMGYGQRNTEDSVGTEVLLGGSAVKLKHLGVNLALLECAHADDGGSNHLVDVLNSLLDTLAQIAVLIAVAELQGLVLAC